MKILAVEKEIPGFKSEDFKPYLKPEAEEVLKLYQQGFIREIYFNDEHNAVIILECETRDQATSLIKGLPLVENGLIEFSLTELHPYTGFSRLLL